MNLRWISFSAERELWWHNGCFRCYACSLMWFSAFHRNNIQMQAQNQSRHRCCHICVLFMFSDNFTPCLRACVMWMRRSARLVWLSAVELCDYYYFYPMVFCIINRLNRYPSPLSREWIGCHLHSTALSVSLSLSLSLALFLSSHDPKPSQLQCIPCAERWKALPKLPNPSSVIRHTTRLSFGIRLIHAYNLERISNHLSPISLSISEKSHKIMQSFEM